MLNVILSKKSNIIVFLIFLIVSSTHCCEVLVDKENYDFSNVMRNSSSGIYKTPPPSPTKSMAKGPRKSPTKSPPKSPTKSPLAVYDPSARSTTKSPPESPTKKGSTSPIKSAESPSKKGCVDSPRKAGIDAIGGVEAGGVDGDTAFPSARKKLFADDSGKQEGHLLEDSPLINHKNSFILALARSRENAASQPTEEKNYLCALPTEDTSEQIEVVFQEACSPFMPKKVLEARSKHTVMNCALKNWSAERCFHMTLDLRNGERPLDMDRVKLALQKVEFPFKGIGTLGRFIVIRLHEPVVKQDAEISQQEMNYLKTYLEYSDLDPYMHVSLVKVTDTKKQMKCVQAGLDEIQAQVSPGSLHSMNQKLQNKGARIYMTGILKTVSEVMYWLIHLNSGEKVREYLSKIHMTEAIEGRVDAYINRSAALCLHNFSQLPAVAQQYIYKEYGINHDFMDQIGITLEGKDHYQLNKDLVVELFSSLFLNNWRELDTFPAELGTFHDLARFCILRTESRMSQRSRDILTGVIQVSSEDADSMFGFLSSVAQDLPEETKKRYLDENEKDGVYLRDLKEHLSLLLIKSRFFGLNINSQFFSGLGADHQGLLEQVRQCVQSGGYPADSLVQATQEVTMGILKSRYLDRKFTIQPNFNFRKAISSIKPFVCIPERVKVQLQEEILGEVARATQENLQKIAHGAVETVTFSDSKIPSAALWHECFLNIQLHFTQTMQGVMFRFSDIGHQPIEEDDDDDSQDA